MAAKAPTSIAILGATPGELDDAGGAPLVGVAPDAPSVLVGGAVVLSDGAPVAVETVPP